LSLAQFLDGLLEKFRTNQDTVETTYASQMAHALAKTIKSSSTTMEDECPICLDCPLIEDTVITPCAHAFCRDCLVGILKNNASSQESSLQCPNGTCPSCNETIDAKDIITLSRSPEDEMVTTSYLLAGSPAKPMVKDEPKTHHVAARQTLEKALRGAGSSKLTAVISELHKVWEQDPRSKVLIYSQYLGFLDLLQAALDRRSIPTGRLDGKLSLKERVSVLEKFRQDTNDNTRTTGSVLLMSMKAGGVGINMVAASSVFICDPWWNEAVQDQCIARVHRIGQMASVVRVRKFVVKDSVEEQIVELQRRKRNISCAILSDANNDGALSNNTTPTLEDFKILFGASTS
jgi:SNF2 family DNA or RNA helicase